MQKKLDGDPNKVPPAVECKHSATGTYNSSLSSVSITPSNNKSSLSHASIAFDLCAKQSLSSKLYSLVNS